MFDTCNVFIPTKPIKRSVYKCDKIFHVDYALELCETFDSYVVAFISGKISEFYLWSPNEIRFIKRIKVDLPNQHKTGGSSAARFGRIRDEKLLAYTKHLVDQLIQLFVPEGKFVHKGLFIAGSGEFKDRIQSEDKFKTFLSKHLIQTLTIPEISDQVIHETFTMIESILVADEISATDNLIKCLEEDFCNPSRMDLYVFGEEVWEYLSTGQLDMIYVCSECLESLAELITDKIVVNVMDNSFRIKYGELVGRKYYALDIIED